MKDQLLLLLTGLLFAGFALLSFRLAGDYVFLFIIFGAVVMAFSVFKRKRREKNDK